MTHPFTDHDTGDEARKAAHARGCLYGCRVEFPNGLDFLPELRWYSAPRATLEAMGIMGPDLYFPDGPSHH